MSRKFDEDFEDEFDEDEDEPEVVRIRLNRFEQLAMERPSMLLAQVQSGTLDDGSLGQALQALGKLPGDKATMVLMDHLKHPDRDVVASAVEGLSAKLEGNVHPAIMAILKTKLARVSEIGTPVAMIKDRFTVLPRVRK